MIHQSQIRIIREKLGMTLRELARRTNMSATFISDVERGHRAPSVESMEKISAVLKAAKASPPVQKARKPVLA